METRYRNQTAKRRALALIERHPEIGHRVSLGGLVSKYRVPNGDSEALEFQTNWSAIVDELQMLLGKTSTVDTSTVDTTSVFDQGQRAQ